MLKNPKIPHFQRFFLGFLVPSPLGFLGFLGTMDETTRLFEVLLLFWALSGAPTNAVPGSLNADETLSTSLSI